MSACRYVGKFQYRDEDDALRQVRLVKRTKKGENKKQLNRLHAYPCPDGGHWHIGHDRFKRGKLDSPASIAKIGES
jgi:hypothetical protein